jgi:hypothetical protein
MSLVRFLGHSEDRVARLHSEQVAVIFPIG